MVQCYQRLPSRQNTRKEIVMKRTLPETQEPTVIALQATVRRGQSESVAERFLLDSAYDLKKVSLGSDAIVFEEVWLRR
jgi:hypothetical protein